MLLQAGGPVLRGFAGRLVPLACRLMELLHHIKELLSRLGKVPAVGFSARQAVLAHDAVLPFPKEFGPLGILSLEYLLPILLLGLEPVGALFRLICLCLCGHGLFLAGLEI